MVDLFVFFTFLLMFSLMTSLTEEEDLKLSLRKALTSKITQKEDTLHLSGTVDFDSPPLSPGNLCVCVCVYLCNVLHLLQLM